MKYRTDKEIKQLMSLPIDTTPATPPPRKAEHIPFVYRMEEIRRVEVQRPLDLDDEFIDQFPFMAAALTQAHRLRRPYELI